MSVLRNGLLLLLGVALGVGATVGVERVRGARDERRVHPAVVAAEFVDALYRNDAHDVRALVDGQVRADRDIASALKTWGGRVPVEQADIEVQDHRLVIGKGETVIVTSRLHPAYRLELPMNYQRGGGWLLTSFPSRPWVVAPETMR